MLTLFFYIPASPVPTVFWIICYPPPPPAYLLLYPNFSPVNAASISLSTRFLPPPSHQVAERPSTWTTPPPSGRHNSYARPSPDSHPKGVPCAIMCLNLPVWLPPISALDLCPCNCWPQEYPVRGYLPPYTCLHNLTPSPPCRPRPQAYSSADLSGGVVFLVPHPL